MQRVRLSDFQLRGGPEAVGQCVGNTGAYIADLNAAQERLMMDPSQPDEGWYGLNARLAFTIDQDDPFITLPRHAARLTAIDICKRPVLIRNEWYEFLDFGIGQRPGTCCESSICENTEVFQRSNVVTPVDLVPNKLIRVYATDDTDFGKRVLIQGKDANGATLYTQDGLTRTDGKFLILASPFATTIDQFSELAGIQKDVTNGPVRIFSVDAVSGAETLLLTMEPSEQTALYQRYFLNGLPLICCGEESIQVAAMVKLEYIPVRVPTDYLLIQSIPALIEEMQYGRYNRMDSPAAKSLADRHHALAIRHMVGLSNHYAGKERTSITVPLWGSDILRAQPV